MDQQEERDPYAPPDTDGTDTSRPGGTGAGRTPPPLPPRRGPQDPRQRPRRPGQGLLAAALVALVTSFVLPPVGVPACVFVVAWAVRTRRRAADTGGAPGSLAAIALATAGVVVPVLLVALFWGELSTYQACMSGANTHQAQDDCRRALEDGLLHRLGQ